LLGGVPGPALWYTLAAVLLCCVGIAWARPSLWPVRAALAGCTLLLIAPEYAFGKVEHVDHLFLLAHVWSPFVPWALPHPEDPALGARASAARAYQAGLLSVYTLAGTWKVFDLTVRNAIKGGRTWLDSDAAFFTVLLFAARAGRDVELWAYLRPLFAFAPLAYLLLALVLVPAALTPWRRPYLAVLVPVVTAFHVVNGVLGLAYFYFTALTFLLLFTPYDRVMGRKRHPRSSPDARPPATDGFGAYRARVERRSWWRAALLYHPAVEAGGRLYWRLKR
jgi:hypothetical protein